MFIERKCMLEENKAKAFSLIINKYCTKEMQNRVQTHPKYDTDLVDDPIQLIDAIKVLIHDTARAQYPIASVVMQLTKWLNIKQHEDEKLTEYVNRVKYHRDIVKNQIGTGLLHNYVKHTAAYTDASASDADKTKMLYDSFEELSAYIVLCGSDKAKYRTLEKGFVNQYSLKNDQYPKTIQDMTDALSKHPFDEEYHAPVSYTHLTLPTILLV